MIPRDNMLVGHAQNAKYHTQSLTGSRDMSTQRSQNYAAQHTRPIARAARPRSSLRHPMRTSRTSPCAARRVGVDRRRDRDRRRRTTRQRSCGAFKQQTVSACEQAARVRAAAAHRVPRRCPATAGPPSEALEDCGPAKERGLRRWGSTDLRPDTLAGQKNGATPVGKGTSRGRKALGQGFRARTSCLDQSRLTTLQKGTRSMH